MVSYRLITFDVYFFLCLSNKKTIRHDGLGNQLFHLENLTYSNEKLYE